MIGARWWRTNLASTNSESGLLARRDLLSATLIAVGAISVTASTGCDVFALPPPATPTLPDPSPDSTPDSVRAIDRRDALEMQRTEGWDFGADGDEIALEDDAESFDPGLFDTLAADLRPRQARWRPFYIPTLFAAAASDPTSGDNTPLREVLHPIDTPSMNEAYHQGRAIGAIMAQAPAGRLVLVDVQGPEAVALATGMSRDAEPVFLFDNWPHPRGVVPSHRTLAATAHHRDELVRNADTRSGAAPAVCVLDRARLSPYVDDSGAFDNRYMARVPPAEKLKALGIVQVLYVVDTPDTPDSDDLNADFVAYEADGIEVRKVARSDFSAPVPSIPAAGVARVDDDCHDRVDDVCTPARTYGGVYYYGGYPHYWGYWWIDYGWGPPPVGSIVIVTPGAHGVGVRYGARPTISSAHSHRFAARPTAFAPGVSAKRRPVNFGRVPVYISLRTGHVVGTPLAERSYSGSSHAGGVHGHDFGSGSPSGRTSAHPSQGGSHASGSHDSAHPSGSSGHTSPGSGHVTGHSSHSTGRSGSFGRGGGHSG
jgi:hypothetical protein